MSSKKFLLTYKRKRFSTKPDLPNATISNTVLGSQNVVKACKEIDKKILKEDKKAVIGGDDVSGGMSTPIFEIRSDTCLRDEQSLRSSQTSHSLTCCCKLALQSDFIDNASENPLKILVSAASALDSQMAVPDDLSKVDTDAPSIELSKVEDCLNTRTSWNNAGEVEGQGSSEKGLANPQSDITCLSRIDLSVPMTECFPEIFQDLRGPSTSNNVFVDDENNGREKELQWLEAFDRELQEKREKRGTDFDKIGIHNGLSCYEIASAKSKASVAMSQNQFFQGIDGGSSGQIKFKGGNLPLENSLGFEWRQQREVGKISSSTNFLGFSLQPNSEGLGFSAKPSQNFSTTLKLWNGDPVGLPWSNKFEDVSSSRYKFMLEDIRRSSLMHETVGTLSDKNRCDDWSDEELDFLWIGVRRYGVHNWAAMLRDPRFRFLRSRMPDDLAKKWGTEQTRLLSSSIYHPIGIDGLNLPPSSCANDVWSTQPSATHRLYGGLDKASSSRYSDLSTVAETKLSLGGSYMRNDISMRQKRQRPLPSKLSDTLREGSSASSFQTYFRQGSHPYQTDRGRCHKGRKISNPKGVSSLLSPMHQRSLDKFAEDMKPPSRTESRNLPHWLREVVAAPARPEGGSQPPMAVSAAETVSAVLRNNGEINGEVGSNIRGAINPTKTYQRRGLLQRKPVGSSKTLVASQSQMVLLREMKQENAGKPVEHLSHAAVAANKIKELNGIARLSQNRQVTSGAADGLIVADSGESSEETVSDRQNNGP